MQLNVRVILTVAMLR